MSLDGYFEGPGGELDWHSVDEELHQYFNDVLAPMSVFIDGRVNYELMASYWPHADEDPSATVQEREFARIWRDMPKLVYSRTLQHAGWNATILREVVPEDIQQLKQQPGGDMVVGAANFAPTFPRDGLTHGNPIHLQPVLPAP